MTPVTSRYRENRLWQNHNASLRSLSESATVRNTDSGTALKDPVKDQAVLTDSASVSKDERIQKLLDKLKKNFPGITFEVVPDSGSWNLKEKAASLGQGKHILLSESFLARMGSSDKDFETCKTVLLSSVLLLSENHAAGVFLGEKQAVSWKIEGKEDPMDTEKETLAKMLESLKEAKSGSSQKIKVSAGNVSFETGELYRKLARAGDKALIQDVMSETYRNMANLRIIACLGEEKDRAKAQRAIRSLQKLVVRSRQKMRHVDQESLLKLKRQRAIKRQEEAKAREIQKELKKVQTKKMRLNKKIMEEGDAADREIRRLKNYLAQTTNFQAPATAPAAAEFMGDISSGEAAAVSAEQISVSEPVAF